MILVGSKERETQRRVIELLEKKLGYEYLGNLQKKPNNKNVNEELLRKYLIESVKDEILVEKAIYKLKIESENQRREKLYDTNKNIYEMLRDGVGVTREIGCKEETVWLINWKEPLKNHFSIAEEVTIKGENIKRPDIIFYINGIAIGILELKRSSVSVLEGIRQNIDSQKSDFIKFFFNTMQLVMAGNDYEGLRYGTIKTGEKKYLMWKEDLKVSDPVSKKVRELSNNERYKLDKDIIGIFYKERLLDILHNYISYSNGKKIICRPSQFFGISASKEYLRRREGGIIWHTQGSGKSMLMVWLAKWIKENITNSRILIITDRIELDYQIENVFKGVKETIYRTKNGNDLLDKLNTTTETICCSLIHKFGGKREDREYDEYIKDINTSIFKGFKAKGDIYVFVDECHRTQSGKLHEAMKKILPNSIFIGFTGTPLLKKDRKKTIEVFGSYIHTYKFNEAVADKVILDLCYEARKIDQNITSQQKIDEWFEVKTKDLTDYAKGKLKQRWGNMQTLLSSKSRLEQIVLDIIYDFELKDRLSSTRGNAILVAGSIYEACRYYELFQNQKFEKCAIITSYTPNINDIKGESTGEGNTEKIEKYEIYKKMLGDKSVEEFEKEVKIKFVEEPNEMKLLIVVDKLLTGFDAPPATYLYIDKSMRDHALFQAICRVNRLDDESKEYGYIVDYKDLFKHLEKSIIDYTSEVFTGYEKSDIDGLIKDRLIIGKERLENSLESMRALCEPVPLPKEEVDYVNYFTGINLNEEERKKTEPRRRDYYKYLTSLIRSYVNIVDDMIKIGYTENEKKEIKKEIENYEKLREIILIASSEKIDLKSYEASMRHLIDNYIKAESTEIISTFKNMTLIDILVNNGIEGLEFLPENIRKNETTVAEIIENNTRKLITDERPVNPKYYEKMSELLNELIMERKKEMLEYEEYLRKIMELLEKIKEPEKNNKYPVSISTPERRALYENLGENEELAVKIDEKILLERQDSWRGNKIKERVIKNAIREYIRDEETVREIFELVKKQGGY